LAEKASDGFRFGNFVLAPGDRQLRGADGPVELNARYLDALVLLVREAGKLVSKDRFLEEVWRGVPVTDEALTQCIRTLRRQLGDDAARPRFIETVPKHGYRFIAPVQPIGREVSTDRAGRGSSPESVRLGLAGTIGGGIAGLLGGLFYGFAALEPGLGAISGLLVLICVTLVVALVGAAGVAFGIAATAFASGRLGAWCIVGAAAGGLLVGALVKLISLDAFNLLLGRSPGDITGAAEGALLGGAVGLGAWIATRYCLSFRRSMTVAALAGAAAGILISLLGGRLLAGSLGLLVLGFPRSRLRLEEVGALFGEAGFGPTSQVVTAALEGGLFAGCVVGALVLARRKSGDRA
jgi:DNA-binding winged helix-turn-helix (wHTH) protein